MGKKTFRMPTDAELMQLMGAAAESAARKLRAARLLLDDDQWAEAFANAALGLEELGKAHLCLTWAGFPLEIRKELSPRDFTQMFNGHEAKASTAHLILRSMIDTVPPTGAAELIADVEAAAAQTNDTKFRGLYVDLAADGSLMHPDSVSEADAQWVVGRLQELLDWAGPMYAELAGDADFLTFVQEFRENLDVSAIAAAVAQDPDAWMAQLHSALHGQGPAPAWIESAFPPLPGSPPRSEIVSPPATGALLPARED
jgi:AbiV family abortive infection protein